MTDSQWIYVIELAPSGNIKIGRTTNVGKRLAEHINNAHFGGAAVSRVFSLLVQDAEQDERALLKEIRSMPCVWPCHGKEVFAGVTFQQACDAANRIGHGIQPVAVPIATGSVPAVDLIAACVEVMDQYQVARISLQDLRKALGVLEPDTWRYLTPRALAGQLRTAGVKVATIHVPGGLHVPTRPGQRRGRSCKGIKREWLELTVAAA